MRKIQRTFLGLFVILALVTGCDLFSGGQATAPPPPPEAVASRPTITPTPLPPTPTQEGVYAASPASAGEILFVREGQIWAIGVDGDNERALTTLEPGLSLRDLTLSPSGNYLAFSVNSQQVLVLDLGQGQATRVDNRAGGTVGSFAWSPESDLLYYHSLTYDPVSQLPGISEIVRTTMPPGNPPEVIAQMILDTDPALAPGFVLDAGHLIVNEFMLGGDSFSEWKLLDLATLSRIPLAEGYGVWAISSDHSKVLLFNQADALMPEGSPLPLYLAELSATEGASNTTRITPEGDSTAYFDARFTPDNVRIVALQYLAELPDQPDFLLSQVVLLQVDDSGSYRVVPLGPDVGMRDVAFSWYGENGVIVQRLPLTGDATISGLWLLPLDGTPGTQLTTGEQPVVIGS